MKAEVSDEEEDPKETTSTKGDSGDNESQTITTQQREESARRHPQKTNDTTAKPKAKKLQKKPFGEQYRRSLTLIICRDQRIQRLQTLRAKSKHKKNSPKSVEKV